LARKLYDTREAERPEKALLVGRVRGRRDPSADGRCLAELAALADTARAVVVGEVIQRRGRPNPSSFVSKGKLEEIKQAVERGDVDVVIFDEDLSPAQMRNLEREIGRKIVDRSELILDIFARRARTREARIQVEVAQLEYLLPRLTRMWEHLSRLGGGIGTRGPGETQLEVDRRRVRKRISVLKSKLREIDKERQVQSRRRGGEFRVAIVGYTNAGKSTLFGRLTRSKAFVEDRLFATLDATTRALVTRSGARLLVTDTVGFIRKLPHHLVASFRSTLAEVTQANLLIHVIDAAAEDAIRQVDSVEEVLGEIGAWGRPVMNVLNKIDIAKDSDSFYALKARLGDAICLSALKGTRFETLLGMMEREMAKQGFGGKSSFDDGGVFQADPANE